LRDREDYLRIRFRGSSTGGKENEGDSFLCQLSKANEWLAPSQGEIRR